MHGNPPFFEVAPRAEFRPSPATFVGLAHAAEKVLKMLGQEPARTSFLGAVTSVRGSVVDIRFDEHLPPIYSLLRAGDDEQISLRCWRNWMCVTCAG